VADDEKSLRDPGKLPPKTLSQSEALLNWCAPKQAHHPQISAMTNWRARHNWRQDVFDGVVMTECEYITRPLMMLIIPYLETAII
jgi:hypothetical protein